MNNRKLVWELPQDEKKKLYDSLCEAQSNVNEQDFKTRSEYRKASVSARKKAFEQNGVIYVPAAPSRLK